MDGARHGTIRKGGVVACLLALLWALLSASPAQAAPQYEDSEPGDGASVQTAPASVSITFSEPLDDSSTMWIDNDCGDGVDGGAPAVELREMRIDLTEGHYSGTYTVHYIAVGIGGVTGKTEGAFTFDVAEGHPCDGHDKHPPGHDPGHDPNHPKEHHPGHDDNEHGDHGNHGRTDHADHSTMDHGTSHTDHSVMGSAHSSHSDGSSHRADEHGEHTAGNSSQHEGHGSAGGQLASGPLPELPPNGRTVLLALLLCAGLGVVGGVFLRNAG